MTLSTDEYAAQLRASARLDDLHSGLEPERVLLSSRRAKRRRSVAVSLVAIVGATAVALAVPAGVHELRRATQVQPAVHPDDSRVVVDRTNGTITFPWDRYFLTDEEQAEVQHASNLAMSACAAEQGYDIPTTPDLGANIPGNRLFGVWWMPSVEQYGYDVPQTPQLTNSVATQGDGPEPTDDQMAILEACNQTPTVQQFWPNRTLKGVSPDFEAQVLASEAGRAVVQSWDACLARHGLHRVDPGNSWSVADDSGQPPGKAIAVTDAQCKADVGLVEQLAQMVADRQAPFIAAHRSELTTIRVGLEDSLKRARLYIAEHG